MTEEQIAAAIVSLRTELANRNIAWTICRGRNQMTDTSELNQPHTRPGTEDYTTMRTYVIRANATAKTTAQTAQAIRDYLDGTTAALDAFKL